jgi:hypothetical protein
VRSEAEEDESHEKLRSAAWLNPALARQRSAAPSELHFAQPYLAAPNAVANAASLSAHTCCHQQAGP